jgi:hypothetical protein
MTIFGLIFQLQLVGIATIVLGVANLGRSTDLAAARPLTRQMIHSQTYISLTVLWTWIVVVFAVALARSLGVL